ncbi:MAG: uroporphyrinogen-III C-methyltransferase [Rhodospirillaceae bacterium]
MSALNTGVTETSDTRASPNGGRIGTVTLVGAGPGDPDLITRKGYAALQAADVVFFDDLVSPEIVDILPDRARCIYVGKPHHRAVITQADIIAQLIAAAKAGLTVVRLKGGDPMVFGRSAEEIAALQAEHIPVEVVPGVTSASAAGAAMHVSLTHRDYASRVTFVTATRRAGALADISGLAGPGRTMVVYMGLCKARDLKDALLGEGIDQNWPVAVVEHASRPSERVIVTTVSDLPDAVVRENVQSPALFIVGEVVGTHVTDRVTADAMALV